MAVSPSRPTCTLFDLLLQMVARTNGTGRGGKWDMVVTREALDGYGSGSQRILNRASVSGIEL
jgi:hypothetical protein